MAVLLTGTTIGGHSAIHAGNLVAHGIITTSNISSSALSLSGGTVTGSIVNTGSATSFRNRIGIGDGNGTPYTNTGSPGIWLSYNGASTQFMGAESTTSWGVYINSNWRMTVSSGGVVTATTFSGSLSGNATTATTLQTARTIGGVSFNGSANINLPGVNTAGNQNTTGNAASATILQTTRTINGTNFNGSGNITTSTWGTARTITIGNTGKSVNGGGNVSWSLGEIGAQASGHISAAYIDFTVGGDANTYYIVRIPGSGIYAFQRYSISRGYSWTAPDTWNTSSHKGGLTFTFEWSGDTAWGGNDKSIRVVEFGETYSTMVAGMALPVTGGVIVWLRGGGAQYRLHAPLGASASVTVEAGNFTAGDGSVLTTRTDTSNVTSEIYGRWPVRNNNELYVGTNAVIHAGNIGSQSVNYAASSGSTTGNAATATKLQTARSIALGGDVTGSANFDGSANITITATVADDSHNHVISNIDGLQTALNGKQDAGSYLTTSGKAADSNLLDGIDSGSFLRSDAADTATGQIFFDAGFESHPIMLGSGQNFDNIDRSGFYNLYAINTGSTNPPPFDFGTMIVIGNDKGAQGFGLQIAHERLNNGMYVRGMNDTASAWSSWAEIWTSNTDGAGSGLDADLLDGNHASAFALSSHTHSDATTSVSGFMSSTDKTKLNGIAAGAEVNVQSDWNATSGDALILNKPTIPTNNNQLTNGAGYVTSSGVTSVTVGTGLDVTTGATPNITLDLSEFTDMTAAMVGSDEFIVLDAGEERRKAANEINLSIFNNDLSYLPDVTPVAPVVSATNIVGETIEVVFGESATPNIDYYQVWSSVDGGSYGLIAQIPDTDFAPVMTVIDASFSVSGTIAYRVYAVKSGVYSSPGTASRVFTASDLDVLNMSVISLNTAYYIQYDLPDSRFVDHIEIYMDAETTDTSLSRTGATLIYSGENTNYMYQISSADFNKYHQFWVEVIES